MYLVGFLTSENWPCAGEVLGIPAAHTRLCALGLPSLRVRWAFRCSKLTVWAGLAPGPALHSSWVTRGPWD